MQLTKKVISETDQIVSVSNALKTEAEKIVKHRNRISVVYNGCDVDTFVYSDVDRISIRRKIGISTNDKVIIFVGRILRSKGVYELINAFKALTDSYADLHLILIGNGPESATINAMAFSNGLRNKVHMTGSMPHSEISHWLSAADIFVLPSHNEGLPNVVLEAMACSLPVIATRVGGIPEAIEDGQSGVLIREKDPDSLIQAIHHLLSDEDLARKMGINGRRAVEQKFSWQKNAEEMLRIYREVIT
jgi:glycosyltransferase involved in cell wall biosynthesis